MPRRSRPGRGYIYGGGGGGGGGLLSGLFAGMPEPEDPIDEEATPLPENERVLAERGMQFQTYKKPSFFRNLVTGGRAGDQVFDANTRAQNAKNAALAALTTEQARARAAEELEGMEFGNARSLEEMRHQNRLEQENAAMLTRQNMAYNRGNLDTFDASTFNNVLGKFQAVTGADTSEATGRKLFADMQNQHKMANRDLYMDKFSAEAAKPVFDNLSVEQKLLFDQALHPAAVESADIANQEGRFNVEQQPTRRLLAEQALDKLRLANETRRAFGPATVLPRDSVLAGDISGLDLTGVTGAYDEEEQVPFSYINKAGELVETGYPTTRKVRRPGAITPMQRRAPAQDVVPW